ncbi:eukaryotic translation elongation factor 1 alpha 1 [Reticulomyxa filosa]|uniref:Eukaryotic translation elongation factor 1 alpha 1 n=1 Tax=Reticulomyxa filosa TaxID=46433 RepID=X6LGB6_RETFI|nr:eukaryotic translation elongation factor 1 alpha 1 [Reticulomyxa filosa]|eukprot:ETO00182.1 eukaryotic translation elongation factor 1 alpha 1 [Reticulomyxa filosa]
MNKEQLPLDVTVRFYPTNTTGKAFFIEMYHKTVDKAEAGDNVGVNLEKENMQLTATKLTALVFVQDYPGQHDKKDWNGVIGSNLSRIQMIEQDHYNIAWHSSF